MDKNKKAFVAILVFILGWALFAYAFTKFTSIWMAILTGFIVEAFIYLAFDWHVEFSNRLRIRKPFKETKFIRHFQAKLRLMTIRKKWQKSSHSRHIPAMRRHFKRWARINPEIKQTISVILGQMDQLAMMTNIFDTIIKTSEYGHKGEDCRQAYEYTVSQIRQNFSDIYNLMVLAGANQGKATMETLDQIALAKELNSNRIKLELLGELNVEVTRYINQTDGPYDNAMLEAEIETLSRINAVRQSKVPNEMAPSTASGTTSGATVAQTTPKTS